MIPFKREVEKRKRKKRNNGYSSRLGLFLSASVSYCNIPHDDIEENDGQDHATFDKVVNGKGQRHYGDEHGSQGIGNLLEKDLPDGDALCSLDSVWAVPSQAGGGLLDT